jgi:hypothetical protein
MKKILMISALFPVLGFGLEVQPWFGDVYEFHFLESYAYSRFDTVQGARPQLNSPFNAHLIHTALEFCPSSEWSIDGDFQLADTTAVPFTFRSGALQMRYLWFDDIVGDKVSLATGGHFRITPAQSLHDVSCPSHAMADFELNISLGRECDVSDAWRWRFWCFGAIGQAIRGSPWIRAIAAIETNINDQHKWAFLAHAVNGYGRHTHFNPDHFNGYGKIREKAVDLTLRYGYRIGVWGTLRFEYQRRFLAKACPQNVNSFIFSYLVPFSF